MLKHSACVLLIFGEWSSNGLLAMVACSKAHNLLEEWVSSLLRCQKKGFLLTKVLNKGVGSRVRRHKGITKGASKLCLQESKEVLVLTLEPPLVHFRRPHPRGVGGLAYGAKQALCHQLGILLRSNTYVSPIWVISHTRLYLLECIHSLIPILTSRTTHQAQGHANPSM